MQVSNCKNGMSDPNENSAKKVNKKVSNSKMKSQKVAANSNSTPETYRESPQNVRLDTSESDDESVSEESFPQDDMSTEEFPEEESCESENDEQEEDVSDDEEESSNQDNTEDDSDVTDEEPSGPSKKFLLDVDDDLDQHPQFSKQARIDAILEAVAASKDKKGNPVLRSATAALDEAAQTITRMRSDASPRDKKTLIAACTDNDVNAVRRLLVDGNSLNDATDDGESLLSLACSAGYYELAQVLLAMSAQVEDRGQKNDCTPLMEAASAGHIEIIELLIRHGADVNAQSSTGNTPLMYACAGGHAEAVKTLLSHGANVEDHNENGHTPLMEAASAGHVVVAKILLDHGAGINTHSNEFKESALTLACYKGHLDMVRFLLEAGADQEHKTDEMHTALMEASMDGHVEVARLLLDSGAQVNMPTDSFESPLTLAACGGHVDLAMLLIERGANIEEVNDEGYTPLMEAAREGHDEMVSLLLTQGANINAQTEETQETALTLACCGGFLEVADYLIKHGADIELGASTPLMEAAQEGHLDLVKFLLDNKADVHTQTQTGDTALTYACENGHTDVAEVLLHFGAELEHLSEGGRTPLMKACRAGHICTVKFLIQKGADVNRQTTNNDHTPLSLACAGGHQQVVELLLAHLADPFHKLKDNSTMLIEAAKGGHTGVVQLLLDYPTSIPPQQNQPIYIPAPMPHQAPQLNMAQMKQTQLKMLQQQQQQQHLMAQQAQQFMVAPPGLRDVTEVIRLPEPPGMFQPQADMIQNQNFIIDPNTQSQTESSILTQMKLLQSAGFKDGLAYGLTKAQSAVNQMVNQQTTNNMNVAPCGNQHQPMLTNNLCMSSSTNKQKNLSRKKCSSGSFAESQNVGTIETRSAGVGEEEDSVTYIKSSLDKLDNTLQKNIQFNDSGPPPTLLPSGTSYVDITTPAQGKGNSISVSNQTQTNQIQSSNKTTHITAKSEVSQATAISDRPKAKPKNSRKLQQQQAQQKQVQSENNVSLTTPQNDQKQSQSKPEAESQQPQEVLKNEALQEVPQTVPEASSTAIMSPEERERASEGARVRSHIDLETFQKMRLNNLSNCSAHWDPKVFRKIAQLIDPPKSPTETPPESSNSSRPTSPDPKNLTTSDMAELTHIFDHLPGIQCLSDPNLLQGKFKKREPSKEDLEKTLATLSEMNASDFVCDGSFPSLEESLESFNPDDVSAVNPGDDAHGPCNYGGWVDEVIQALNVSPDISNAFHEIAANINNQDLEQYANFFGLNQICKTKWASPQWPPTHHQITSESSSPTNENDDNVIIQDGNDLLEGKEDDQNLLMTIDQAGYTPQFTVEQLQLISQLQQQHQSLLQIDQQTAQNILLPSGANFQVPAPPVIPSAPGQAQKTQADAQQQTKFVFNVDNDKTSQSLQLLFQLPNDGQSQQQQLMKSPDGTQKAIQNVAQTQTMSATGSAQPVTIPSLINHQQGFLNFQLHQQQQQQQQQPGIQMNQQIVSANMQQQKVPQFINKNYQQVQVATQTQMMGTQTQSHAEAVQHPPTTSKLATASVTKKSTTGDQKRKEKSRYALRQASTGQSPYQYDQLQQYANIPGSTSTGTTTDRTIEIDSETESNHDTALTLACAGGHEELVDLLLNRKANIEHRDKKGFTPLILSATAGHEKVVETLINNGADLEAQSERTKDTPLSLACSGGRYEVVELLLKYGANKEHRNVSDYTPLSLAASGGYVNIIKLLLNHGAEINSRTGSKLGISPLMLAAMNGHTSAVRLLLDMGSDINAQIETNRNTALTLACFQGRNEVVSLLLDRKANVEHRAKTGLTPLMEAASGGYIEVGRVLLDKGADVNAAPVPSSRDTALTIAADKGHLKFVDLLLSRGAAVEVKNKKGNSPLWLAANGGHLSVVEALYHAKADIDSQDNRKVSCLMAAFRKGHIKVVKWMVNHVAQFPSDQEMTRYISVVDKEVVDKCHECVKIIRAAKETQATKANINASILLKELDMEKSREDARKAAAAKRRERKKRRKQEKREAQRKLNGDDTKAEGKQGNQKGKASKIDEPDSDESEEESNDEEEVEEIEHAPVLSLDKEEGDSGIDQGSCSSSDAKGATISKAQVEADKDQNSKGQKNQKRKKNQIEVAKPVSGKANKLSAIAATIAKAAEVVKSSREESKRNRDQKVQRSADLTIKSVKPMEKENVAPKEPTAAAKPQTIRDTKKENFENPRNQQQRKSMVFGNSRSSGAGDDFDLDRLPVLNFFPIQTSAKTTKSTTSPTKVPPQAVSSSVIKQPREEEWKEVCGRKPTPSTSTTTTTSSTPAPAANEIGCKKIQVPLNAISRVIGRGGSNINAIRAATGAHIEVEKQGKTQGDRSITIKGVAEATKQAHNLISTLIKDPDADILSMLPRNNFQPVKSSSTTNVVVPVSTSVAVNNGTSLWEKSLNIIPTVQNPVKPASFTATSKTTTGSSSKSTTPTQMTNKSQRPVAKNLFAAPSVIVRPTPSSGKILEADNYKKGMVATNGPPTKPASNSNAIQVLKKSLANTSTVNVITSQTSSSTFASTLSGSSEFTASNVGKKSSSSSPIKQLIIGTASSASSLPPPFTNSNASYSSAGGLIQTVSDPIVSTAAPTTTARSITPIGPPSRNVNASPHSSHIVNTLDLSTPNMYHNTNMSSMNDINQIQSKLGELHVSAQGLEYSLFDNYSKWSQDKPVTFNTLKVSATGNEVDAAKAPGYRGTSINSPVSSKTSSNSATPPSTALATQAPTGSSASSQLQSSNYGDMNVIKLIGQGQAGPVQRPGGTSNNRMDMNFSRGSGLFDYGNSDSSYGSMNYPMNQSNVNASVSRLNPKASSFSTSNASSIGVQNQNKMNVNQYGSSFMAPNNNNNNNNNNFMKSPGSSSAAQQQGYQRSSVNQSGSSSRWFPEYSNYGNQGNQGMDFSGTSPSMSPNNNSSQSGIGPIDDSRKANPAPIGNERSYHSKHYSGSAYGSGQNLLDGAISGAMMGSGRNNWIDKNQQWSMQSNVPVVPRGNLYDAPPEFPMQDIFQYPLDTSQQQMNYMRGVNGQTSFHPGTPFIGGDLANLSSDLQQSPYEFDKQQWQTKWTH